MRSALLAEVPVPDPAKINEYIQSRLAEHAEPDVPAVLAARWLDGVGLLRDSPHRPGLPLRRLLRAHRIEGQHQYPNGRWVIRRVAPAEVEGALKTAELRRRYLPRRVLVLLVGESPPAGGTFFYAANSILYRYTLEAFTTAYGAAWLESWPSFLEAFKALGCYLDDLCEHPVNRLGARSAARKAARHEGMCRLSERIAFLQPRAVIPVARSIKPQVEAAVMRSGHRALVIEALRFPAKGHHRSYVAGLTEALTLLPERGILKDRKALR